MQRIRRSIQVSLRLIGDLLELARAESGQIELEVERFAADALARDVAEDFRAQAAAAGLTLEICSSETLPVETDPARVRQIVSNLLSNAVKYTPRGGVVVTTEAVSDGRGPRPGAWAAIRVIDTGPATRRLRR